MMNYYLVMFQICAIYLVIYSAMSVYFFRKNLAKQMENHLLQMQLFGLQQRSQYLQVQGAFERQRRLLMEREA